MAKQKTYEVEDIVTLVSDAMDDFKTEVLAMYNTPQLSDEEISAKAAENLKNKAGE